MDITPQHQQPAQSDDDLAKVLAGASNDPNERPQSKAEAAGLQFEETPAPGSQAAATAPAPGSTNVNLPSPEMPAGATTSTEPEPTPPAPQATPVIPTPEAAPTVSMADMAPSAGVGGGLDTLKKDALEELRPLIGKLNLPAEEMFDTLLLIIRSTDDQSLLQPAHDAAKSIQDETKRAQALLDIIKEIDYFAGHGQPT